METRTVKPCGMLYSQGREYFLLKPYPIVGDSWEGDNAYRWLVVPRSNFHGKDFLGHIGEVNNPHYTYPHARHIVSTAFVVDYTELPEIDIRVLEDVDVAEVPLNGDPNDLFMQQEEEEVWFEQLLGEPENV